jgi:arylformamidase
MQVMRMSFAPGEGCGAARAATDPARYTLCLDISYVKQLGAVAGAMLPRGAAAHEGRGVARASGPALSSRHDGAARTAMHTLWDISPTLGPGTPPFPGDQPYEQRWTATLGPGCPVNLSALTLSPHLGAHADAPLHYAHGAPAIGAVALEPYLGRCRVIHAIGCGPLVEPRHLQHAAAGLPPRVLVRTCDTAPTTWADDFSAFAPQTIAWLAQRGVRLVGIDSQSVDPAHSKDLPSHQQLFAHDLRVLENLVLDDVAEGDYELIALPLKLRDACASPVRAVLRSLA